MHIFPVFCDTNVGDTALPILQPQGMWLCCLSVTECPIHTLGLESRHNSPGKILILLSEALACWAQQLTVAQVGCYNGYS